MKRLVLLVLLSLLTFSSFGAAGAFEETCTEKCADANRQRIELCNTLYPPKYQFEKHKQCLDDSRTKYDACIAICRAN